MCLAAVLQAEGLTAPTQGSRVPITLPPALEGSPATATPRPAQQQRPHQAGSPSEADEQPAAQAALPSMPDQSPPGVAWQGDDSAEHTSAEAAHLSTDEQPTDQDAKSSLLDESLPKHPQQDAPSLGLAPPKEQQEKQHVRGQPGQQSDAANGHHVGQPGRVGQPSVQQLPPAAGEQDRSSSVPNGRGPIQVCTGTASQSSPAILETLSVSL